MANNIPEIKVAVRFRCYYGTFPLEFSILFMRYVWQYRCRTFCTFDDVRITKMAVGKPEVVITLVWNKISTQFQRLFPCFRCRSRVHNVTLMNMH